MKRFACVFVLLVIGGGCIKPLAAPTLNAIEQKSKDSAQNAALFKATNPKIQAQLKAGPDKAATIKYLNSLGQTLTKSAQSDQNIWDAIKEQHSK